MIPAYKRRQRHRLNPEAKPAAPAVERPRGRVDMEAVERELSEAVKAGQDALAAFRGGEA